MATFGTDTSVGSTILALEKQLPATEERLLRAQAELDAATTERDAVHRALEALRLLSGTPARTDEDRTPVTEAPPVPAEAVPDTERTTSTPAAPAPAGPAPAASAAKKKTPTRKAPARKTAEPEKATPTRATARGAKTGSDARTAAKQEPAARTGRAARPRPVGTEPPTAAPAAGRRTVTDPDSILAVLSGSAEPMRAREVSDKLGLEPLQANVNAVRTRLERLAKDGRAQRPGRGLYTATTQATGSGA
ncbi:prephenate dehydrogenase [Kitasatospora purpeofusca]|uniref:prephenate dehydrogenase n=1 Tax=Kitasatospora purpeofusca TaxID=67352 RepID=UPI003867EB74